MPTLITPLRLPARSLGLRQIARYAGWFAANLPHLLATRAPLAAWSCYVRTAMRRPRLERYRQAKERFVQDALSSGQFGTDWFCGNIPYWLAAFDRYQLFKRPLQALEIGSWEGLSSRFVLDTLPLAHLTCVDTWEGADEHQGMPLRLVEKRFDHNLACHAERLTKFKGTSLAFFAAQPAQPRFDLIYIDGSHHSDDVMLDALRGFALLKVGGVMILDDYLWRFYARRNDDPAAAIHAFLRLKSGCYDLFMAY
ncbi:MAG TPA: class I SAM-dependent methyltransferase, partial [Burkholderiaceae bacterium]|nr:class I SAM-dependent methyltransferase [Burkholderiaceae bacterium]